MFLRRFFSSLAKKNGDIKAPLLLVIDEQGSKHGPLSNREAMRLYDQNKADLVLVNAQHDPPIAKIVPLSLSHQRRLAQEANQMLQRMKCREKEIRLGTNIAPHDYETRAKRVVWLLERAIRVRLVIETKGKQQRDPLGKEKLLQRLQQYLLEQVGKDLQILQAPRLENSQLSMIVAKANAVPPMQQQLDDSELRDEDDNSE